MTEDIKDLVERLRAWDANPRQTNMHRAAKAIIPEAADALNAAQARIEELENQARLDRQWIEMHEPIVKRFAEVEKERDAAQARIEALEQKYSDLRSIANVDGDWAAVLDRLADAEKERDDWQREWNKLVFASDAKIDKLKQERDEARAALLQQARKVRNFSNPDEVFEAVPVRFILSMNETTSPSASAVFGGENDHD